jgi:ABC-type nitrate/sulfonate/bicarbonate transport system ATPase subunit
MIELRELSFRYNEQEGDIFTDFSWSLEQGDACTVLGPSGCGKTSLLYLLSGLRTPTRGQVLIHGELITRPRPSTGLILQDYGLLPWATVYQNIGLGLNLRNFYGPDGKHAPRDLRTSRETNNRIVLEWMDRLGLTEFAEKFPHQLSGGQRQRTAIARTLILKPDLLLMDEPFSSLDTLTRESLQRLTLSLCAAEKITLVVVTHSIEEALFLGNKILLLGHPPNNTGKVLHNPQAGEADYRLSTDFQVLSNELRSRMGIQ